MVIQRRITLNHDDVFPAGVFLKGQVEPVTDFNAPAREDGSRPQQVDRETGLPVWQATFIDSDEEGSKKNTALTVKFLGQHGPVPPENPTPFPWTPVVFTGLSALPYIEEEAGRPRIAWSFRADGMTSPGAAAPAAKKAEA